MGKISPACKAAAKKKFKVWPTKKGGPQNMKSKRKK